jgi:hypothetical protein
MLPVVGSIAVIAILQAATHGRTAVYEPLLTLPLLWLALYHGRAELLGGALAVAGAVVVGLVRRDDPLVDVPEVVFRPVALERLARTDPLTGIANRPRAGGPARAA